MIMIKKIIHVPIPLIVYDYEISFIYIKHIATHLTLNEKPQIQLPTIFIHGAKEKHTVKHKVNTRILI